MKDPANKILERRGGRTGRGWAVAVAVAGHATVVASAILVPMMIAASRPPLEFQPVTIVPVQALGVPEPQPQPEAEPEREAPPKPAPPAEEPKPAPRPRPAPEKTVTQRPEPARPPAPPKQRRGSALGSEIASSPFGASGVGLDNPDFTYGYYVDQMVSMIGGAWAPPRLGGRPEAIVHFRIARDGSISELALVQTSGHRAFDESALRAVRTAAPLPPLPASFLSDSLGVNLIVR